MMLKRFVFNRQALTQVESFVVRVVRTSGAGMQACRFFTDENCKDCRLIPTFFSGNEWTSSLLW